MANNLNRNILIGEVVIVKKNPGRTGPVEDRAFVCESGFGMEPQTVGRGIFGRWQKGYGDLAKGWIHGSDIDPAETAVYQEQHGKFAR